MSRPSLNPSEWAVITVFLLLLGCLSLVAKISCWKAKDLLSGAPPLETVQVEVSGEVLRPGMYELRKNSLCSELLERIKLKRFADLSCIDPKAPIFSPFHIPKLQELYVLIEGEGVCSCELTVPPGTRVSDLKSKITFVENGDPSPFRSRKMLSGGEVFFVEKRK